MRALYIDEYGANTHRLMCEMEEKHNCFIFLLAERKRIYMAVLASHDNPVKTSENYLLANYSEIDKLSEYIKAYFEERTNNNG